jgi:hypothetical protein
MTGTRSTYRPAPQDKALLQAISNLAEYHREHEKFYSSAPREQAVVLQRHARTLLALADRWSVVQASERPVLSPYEATEDLNALDATALDGVLFLEGEGRPAELTRLIAELRGFAAEAMRAGEWLAKAMEASWELAAALVRIDPLCDVLGERHRIIANDWQAADLTVLASRILQRTAEILDAVDFSPAALRADLAGSRVTAGQMYSVAEMIDHAAELLSVAAGTELDSERRWREFRFRVQELLVPDATEGSEASERMAP